MVINMYALSTYISKNNLCIVWINMFDIGKYMIVKSNVVEKKIQSYLGASSEIQANGPSQYVSVPQISTNLMWKVERQQ